MAIHSDITEERKAAERIAHLAHHDPLTGLPNRIRFREQVDAALSERAPNEQIALVHLNLDRFKSINDTMGVSTGDTILRQVAERIRASASSENTLARLGSDEFAILQRGRQQPWNVTALADQIRRELSEPFFSRRQADRAQRLRWESHSRPKMVPRPTHCSATPVSRSRRPRRTDANASDSSRARWHRRIQAAPRA
ncbi:diguanylate cyclase domain-containing protein [Rhizobium yanglingense]